MPDVMINGPEGRLEGRYVLGPTPTSPIALILHPHPRHGGTMNNKVVYSIYHTLARNGFACLRFNFRGVGRSQGCYAHGEGELADAASALDWLQATCPDASQCWVGGFSFGAWICMQLLMRRPEVKGFIAVAPPANLYDFGFLSPCPVSGLIVQGEEDDIVPSTKTYELSQRLNQQKNILVSYETVPKADHFFTGCIDEMSALVQAYLENLEGAADFREP